MLDPEKKRPSEARKAPMDRKGKHFRCCSRNITANPKTPDPIPQTLNPKPKPCAEWRRRRFWWWRGWDNKNARHKTYFC